MSLQTPRILPAHLHAFVASSSSSTGGSNSRNTPRAVRVLGTVSALRGETAMITCGNHGDIVLRLNPDSHLQMGHMVEVIGKVVEVEPQVSFVVGWWGSFACLLYLFFKFLSTPVRR
jgi:Replication factor A protein 3